MCSPTKGNKVTSGCLTLAFSGAQKRAEMLRHPCILGDPQTTGEKIRRGTLTLDFSGAHKWAKMLCHPCILKDPQNKGGQNLKRVPHPCLLGSPKKGGNATSPLHWGPLLRGQNQKWLNWGQGQNFGCAIQKNTTKEFIAKMVCLCRKNTLKTPPQTIFLKGGVSKTPHAIGFLRTPPPPVLWCVGLCGHGEA